jgi:polyphosphate kinase 2
MNRKTYKGHLQSLQVELSRLQDWVTATGYRAVIVFEGRDAAGKGGTISALTENVSPRVFRVNALPAPSDRQKTQLYLQRYIERFPAAGEVIIFDRSWYNRAGVEVVMGFCTPAERDYFLDMIPRFERALIDEGIHLIKYWLEVSSDEQRKRLEARIENEKKNWKLSNIDLEARHRWYDFSRARDLMLDATDTDENPWNIVRADDKRVARLNLISHLLSQIPYKDLDADPIVLPERATENNYDDETAMVGRHYVTNKYA